MAVPARSPLRAFVGRFVLAFVLLALLTAGGIAGAYWRLNDKIDRTTQVKVKTDPEREEPGEPANFLIIGSDTRSFVDTEREAESFGDAATQSGQRSDTIMIAHVEPERRYGLLVSFPRDLWVDIPGMGEAKINAAFNQGPNKVIETIRTNFDIPIHHYVEVDFEGFRGLVDAIGHVPIYFAAPARDTETGLLAPLGGCAELDGENALAFVRSRQYEYYEDGEWKLEPTADLGRIRRQQYFIRSLAEVAIESAARNPLRADSIADKALENVVFDEGMGLSDLLKLANTFRSVDPAEVEMFTVPATGDRSADGQSILVLDDAQAEPLFARLRRFEEPRRGVPRGVKPREVAVRVLNGSGVPGVAANTLGALKAEGFATVDPPDDADRLDYETTEVRYATGAEAKARLLQAYLGGAGELVPLVGDAEPGVDVVLVVGRDFDQVTAPTTATTVSPTVTTTTLAPTPGRNPAPERPEPGKPLVGC